MRKDVLLLLKSASLSLPAHFHLYQPFTFLSSVFIFIFFAVHRHISQGVSHPKTLVYSAEHHYILPGQPCKQWKLASYTSLACISVPSLQEFVLLHWNSPIKTILWPFHTFSRSRWFFSLLLSGFVGEKMQLLFAAAFWIKSMAAISQTRPYG